jgi:hypothetical protein
MNPLPKKANAAKMKKQALLRMGHYQIVPKSKRIGITAEQCDNIFYYLRDVEGLAI